MTFERPVWPNGARCAVSLTFDNFGESFDLLRYGHAGGANADGVYATRRGVDRILDILSRHSVPATFFVEGWGIDKYRPLAREIVAAGHEIAAHGWMHERWSALSKGEEQDLVKRTTDTIADVIGQRPQGWRSPSGLTTENTLGFLRDEDYRYDSSFGDDDTPYLLQTAVNDDHEIVELPWSWPLDDAAYYAYPGVIRQPSDVAALWIDEFNAAYDLTGSFMLVCHPRYSGRPARARALEHLIQHIRAHDDVWFARCDEIARHVREWADIPHHPFPSSMSEVQGRKLGFM